jgi:hypothetical protein
MNLAFLNRDIPKRAMLVVVALAAVAGVVTGREKPGIEVVQDQVRRTPLPAGLDIDLAKLERPEAGPPLADPFAPRAFGGEPRPQAAAAPQKPPVPPLPFQYVGKVIEDGKQEVYVMRDDKLLAIASGQKIGNDYRVERISGKSITFTYLPLKTRQTLDLPAQN